MVWVFFFFKRLIFPIIRKQVTDSECGLLEFRNFFKTIHIFHKFYSFYSSFFIKVLYNYSTKVHLNQEDSVLILGCPIMGLKKVNFQNQSFWYMVLTLLAMGALTNDYEWES